MVVVSNLSRIALQYDGRKEGCMWQFCTIIKILSVPSRNAAHIDGHTRTKYRGVRMRADSNTLPLIQKIPSGDALGASDSCMHILTVHTYKTCYNSVTQYIQN